VSTMEYMKKKSNNNKFKDHGLNVPEHYFESVEARIFQQLQSESNSEFSKGKVKFLWWPYIAAAASLLLVWHVYQLNESSTVNTVSEMAMKLSEEELNTYAYVSLNETELFTTLDQEDYEFLYNEAIEWDKWEAEALEQDHLFTEFQLMN
jgi:hypothetical protein